MGQRISLEQIKIAEPCHEAWDTMTGNEQKRFCESCGKHVHDLSKMSREDAEMLVSAGPSVCVRMHVQPDGVVQTADVRPHLLDYQPASRRGFFASRWFKLAASVAAMLGVGSLFQTGCRAQGKTVLQGTPTPLTPPAVRTMGIVAMPETIQGEALPATQPMEPMVMGEIAVPTMNPSTKPATAPTNATFWKTSPYDASEGFLLPTDD